jgi:hypothetical protein
MLCPLRRQGLTRWGNLCIAVVAFLGSVGIFTVSMWTACQRMQQFGVAMFANLSGLPFVCGLLLLVGSIHAARLAYMNWHKSAVLYENGIAVSGLRGVQAWQWREISRVMTAVSRCSSIGIYTGTRYKVTLERGRGERITLDNNFENIAALVSQVRDALIPRLYERYIHVFNQGKAVTFGDVSIDRLKGMRIGADVVPWTMVYKIILKDGVLQINIRRPKKSVSTKRLHLDRIPNAEVMLMIVDQFVEINR